LEPPPARGGALRCPAAPWSAPETEEIVGLGASFGIFLIFNLLFVGFLKFNSEHVNYFRPHEIFLVLAAAVFSFVFDKFYLIMD